MSEVRLPAPLKATVCTDIDEVRGKAGAFEFSIDSSKEIAGIIYCCPCGCGASGALAFRPKPSPSWEWSGDPDLFG